MPRRSRKNAATTRRARRRDAPPRPSLTDRVYHAFRKDIITGQFQPGEALRENQIARRYGTSRTPVREAAARLQRDHLLRIVPNIGYFVGLINIPELNELVEYRCVIEGACAELAAKRKPDKALLTQLDRHSQAAYYSGDRKSYFQFIEVDTAFHVAIARLTRNRWLVNAVSDLRSQIERLLYSVIEIGDYGPALRKEHRKIYQAIRNGDALAARKRMFEHVMGAKGKILQVL